MATYVIGDIQGCYRELLALLAAVKFDRSTDVLWLTGDLVNRGPASLAVLRAVRDLGESAISVLGNHDLHLLKLAYCSGTRPHPKDTLEQVLTAPDRDELLDWLRHRPLIHRDKALGYTLIHAGLPASWTLDEACIRAEEITTELRSANFLAFLQVLYGDHPSRWDPQLKGFERLRCITNCLTRMRYSGLDGTMDFEVKGPPDGCHRTLIPWFELPDRASAGDKILFGHWSTLRLNQAQCAHHKVYPLDTGAVWGGELTAMRLEDGRYFSVGSSENLQSI